MNRVAAPTGTNLSRAFPWKVSNRFGAIVLLVILGTIALNLFVGPIASKLVDQWSRRDVEMRSNLIFNSLRLSLGSLLAIDAGSAINELFDQVALDERVLAVGFCDPEGRILFRSKLIPEGFSCEALQASAEIQSGTGTFSIVETVHASLLVGHYPFSAEGISGNLVVLHDLSFAGRRSAEARRYLTYLIIGLAIFGSLMSAFGAFIVIRSWHSRVRQTIERVREGSKLNPSELEGTPLGREISRLIRELDTKRDAIDSENVHWSASTLRAIIEENLSRTQIIAVSNREPYIHNHVGGGIKVQHPASGLVVALEPVMQACGGTWIAHGSGSGDRETVDANDRISVPPDDAKYVLRRVWLTEEEQQGYYYGFANEGLWPLCHVAYIRPVFREADWNSYKRVNERFAAAVVAEATQPDPIILVQDYHLALLPSLLRTALPAATIISFWHIPWPNPETFGICPWKKEILSGLMGSTILGFHTRFHCNNFIDTVDRFMESRIDREMASVTLGGLETFIRPYPIAIEWPPAAMNGQPPVEQARREVRARFGLNPDIKIAVGVERFDYTKGILDRMRAVEVLLSDHPEWLDKFVLLQVAAPTRSALATYRDLQTEATELATSINRRFGTANWKPIVLLVEHHEPARVFEFFRAAELCVVSSLHDGMNLVAKEFVASRDDEIGVLVLSSFAGASRELSEAVLVNPYDTKELGDSLHKALLMPISEQKQRMRFMRDQIRTRNVYRWAGKMLLDAEQLRTKQRIVQLALKHVA